MILNREAKTTGSRCIALLRRIASKVEVANGVHLLRSMEIIKPLVRERDFPRPAPICATDPTFELDWRQLKAFVPFKPWEALPVACRFFRSFLRLPRRYRGLTEQG
jgi:hypothetical protein